MSKREFIKNTNWKLKPCPFCGNQDILIERTFNASWRADEFSVGCWDCDVAPETDSQLDIEDCVDIWNKRYTDNE